MPLVDDDKSSLDVLAEGSLQDNLGTEEHEEKAPDAPVADPKIIALEAKLASLEDKTLQQEMELRTHRGFLAAQRDNQQQPPNKDEPADEAIDYDALTKDMETRGAKALHEFLQKEITKGVKGALKEVDGKIATTRQQDQNSARIRSSFDNELNNIRTEFPDFEGDKEFVAEADQEAIRILTIRLGRSPDPNGADNKYYSPGDLMAAVSRVALKRERAGKGSKPADTNGSSIRAISRRVDNSDNLGSRGDSARRAAPKSIDDTDWPEREKRAAKTVYNKLKELNPGMNEEKWIKYYNEGASNEGNA